MSLNSTIADLMLEKGRAQAQGALGSGQAWGSAVSSVGDTVAGIPQQMEVQKQRADVQRARDARSAFSDAMKNTPAVTQDGLKLYDVQGIGQFMSQKGYGPEFAAAAGHLDTINQSTIAFQQGRLGLIKSGATALLAAGADPQLTNDFLEHLKGNQVYSDATIQDWQNRIKTDPTVAGKIVSYLAGPQKAEVLSEGQQGFDPITHQPIPGLQGAPKPVVLSQGAIAVDPATGQTLASGASKPMDKNLALSYQSDPKATPEQKAMAASWLDAEAKAQANPNEPITVKTMENGRPVEKVMTRAQALAQGSFPSQPPASIQIRNEAAAQAAAAPPIDALRPTGPEANKINPITGLTANAEYQNALIWAVTGKVPSAGMSSAPGQRLAANQMIQNKGAAILAAAGVDAERVQAQYRAHATALSRIVPIATMTAASAGAAKDYLQLAADASGDIQRTQSKWFNKPWQDLQKGLTSAAGLNQFELYIYSASREYAKVVTGSAASVEGLTDSAAKEMARLLNAAQSKEAFAAVSQGMQNDMDRFTGNQNKQIANESAILGNFFAAVNGTPAPTSKTTPQTTPLQKPIPGIAGGMAESIDGGLTWKRIK